VQRAADDCIPPSRLTLAEVPQLDHRIGQVFEGIMQLAYALKPKQHAGTYLPSQTPAS
jgi:hypothetical protein